MKLKKTLREIMTDVTKGALPVALMISAAAGGQSAVSDHWEPAQLMERAKHLRQLAFAGDGSASETLEKYPHHFTMLAFRSRSGGGELHRKYADMLYILDGHATLLTGGEVTDPKSTGPGEIRGAAINGDAKRDLKKGDVIHIPAGLSHQMLIADGESVTYFVVKIQESDGQPD